EVEAKLTRTVEELLDEDTDWVLSHLRPLVGQASDAASSQEEAFAAWRRFFEALAEQHALVLVFEDIQWADDGLLDFIEHLVDWVRDVPDVDPVHGAARAARTAAGRGRREAERGDGGAVAALGRRDGDVDLRAERAAVA